MQPLVTAVLPTIRRDRSNARRALACMLSQTWQNIEWLILDDKGKYSFDDDPGITKLTYCRAAAGTELGEKLNIASRIGHGEYLVHFHDDDWSDPFRVAHQVGILEETKKAVTVYRNLLFTDGTRRWLQTNWPGGFGMSLCHRRDWALKYPFPEKPPSEDWEFVANAMRRDQFVQSYAGEHMMVSFNPESAVIGQGWKELP